MCVYEMRHKPKQEAMPDNPWQNQETKLVFKVSFEPVYTPLFALMVTVLTPLNQSQQSWNFGISVSDKVVLRT